MSSKNDLFRDPDRGVVGSRETLGGVGGAGVPVSSGDG